MLRFWLPMFLVIALGGAVRADDWPQWLGPRRDGVWRETGIAARFPQGGPAIRWRTPIGAGYAGPAVVGDRVYVMDRQKPKDAREGENPPRDGALPGSERILCLNAKDGKIIWKHEYDCPYRISFPAGPRTTPVIHQGKLYTLGAMGNLICLDAADGKVHWERSFPKDFPCKPPVWGWSAHLLIDGDRIISLVGGDGSAVVAFHKDTGKEIWRALTIEEVGYAPPVICEAGGRRQLIVWHSEALNSLDPATGKLHWSVRFPDKVAPVRPAITVAMPRQRGDLLFVTSPHHGPLMMKLAADKPEAKLLWKGKSDRIGKPDGLHSLMCTPVLTDGHVYGICSFGVLRCLEADTGKRLWESQALTGGKGGLFSTSFLVQQGDRFFIFTERGDLIIARLTPMGYEETDRAHILDPSQTARGQEVVWSHPAFAHRCMFARNDREIVSVWLGEARDGGKD